MASLPFYSACCALLAVSASARHLHRPSIHHEHQRRQANTTPTITITSAEIPSTTVNVPAASITAGNAAIANMQQIQEGLSDLPANLLSFVQAVEARLEDMEGMLMKLMGTSAPTAAPAVSPTQATAPPLAAPSSTLPVTAVPPQTLPSSNASSPIFSPTTTPSLANATSVIPGETTFQTYRLTSTRVRTTTAPNAGPTGISSFPSGISVASGNWTLPLATSGRPAVAPSVLRTAAVPALPGPTAWDQ